MLSNRRDKDVRVLGAQYRTSRFEYKKMIIGAKPGEWKRVIKRGRDDP